MSFAGIEELRPMNFEYKPFYNSSIRTDKDGNITYFESETSSLKTLEAKTYPKVRKINLRVWE